MGEVLARAPVYFAAAQVKHNAIPAMREQALRIKLTETFRKLGYTDQRDETKNIVLRFGDQTVSLDAEPALICLNSKRTEAVALHPTRLWLQTTAYSDFDAFKASFLRSLSALHSEVQLDYIDSVSMRMLDAIAPRPDEALSDYLPKELLGLESWAKERGWTMQHQSAEHRFLTGNGHRIVLRCTRRQGRISLPPDLDAFEMPFLDRHQTIDGEHALLDSDAIFEGRQPVEVEKLDVQLLDLKADLTQCFRTVVSLKALEAWR